MEKKKEKKKEEEKEMTERRAKSLLSRMARAVGLKLVEWPRDAWYQNRWCFSDGKARYTCNYYSLVTMLDIVLKLVAFNRCPGTWDSKAGEKTSYPNPFFNLDLDELELKLDVLVPPKKPRKPKK